MPLRLGPMRPRLRIILAVTAVAVTGAGVGTALAANVKAPAVMAIQPGGQYVFACVGKKTGAVKYFEFRKPLPHQCDAGDELWHLAAVPTTSASPAPSTTTSATPTQSSSSSPSACASPTATPTPTSTPTATPTPTPTATPTACQSVAASSSPSPDIFSSSGLGSAAPLASPEPP